jgi:hypothetical protein
MLQVGELKTPMIPVARVQVGKAYVSYHLMGVSVEAKLVEKLSAVLRARMQGMRKGEYVADAPAAPRGD